MTTKPPAPRPCVSCPYRCDVPSGVWSASEYLKLHEYDEETGRQPPGVFLCHQNDGRLCAGWVAVHDMENSLSLRLATAMGVVAVTDLDTIIDYTTDVPLFGSGYEAAEHGLADIRTPGRGARKMIQRLSRKQPRRRRRTYKEQEL